jgi:phosphohistidine phosphatase SixA
MKEFLLKNGIYVPEQIRIISSQVSRAVFTAQGIAKEISVLYDEERDARVELPVEFRSDEQLNECLTFLKSFQERVLIAVAHMPSIEEITKSLGKYVSPRERQIVSLPFPR